jgi:DNA-binding Lrp family transcriptional regulator
VGAVVLSLKFRSAHVIRSLRIHHVGAVSCGPQQNQGQAMKAFFVQIKTELGKAYEVAAALVDAEIASEVYSTAGDYDLLVKFYVDENEDVGHFVNQKVH